VLVDPSKRLAKWHKDLPLQGLGNLGDQTFLFVNYKLQMAGINDLLYDLFSMVIRFNVTVSVGM
jgi:hypothetical protein